jgi:hypothetical protein
VELYLQSLNTPSRHGAHLKHGDFTFTVTFYWINDFWSGLVETLKEEKRKTPWSGALFLQMLPKLFPFDIIKRASSNFSADQFHAPTNELKT